MLENRKSGPNVCDVTQDIGLFVATFRFYILPKFCTFIFVRKNGERNQFPSYTD